MNTFKSARKWFVIAALVAAGLFAGRLIVAPAPASADESDAYRVELVQNDPYKVQTGLNMMAKQGWYYVSSITRADGKLLLVFRKGDRP